LAGGLVVLFMVGIGERRAEAADRRALIIPTTLGGIWVDGPRWQRTFDIKLSVALARAELRPVATPSLTVKDKQCADATCMAGIALEHEALIVIGARVFVDKSEPPTYRMAVVVYDAGHPGVLRREEASCPNCSDFDATELMYKTAGKALAPPEVVKPPDTTTAAASPAPSPVPQLVDVTRDRLPPPARWALRGTGLVLVGAGLVFIGEGIYNTVQNGDIVQRNGRPFRQDTSQGQTISYAVGASALVVGAVLTTIGWLPMPVKVRESVAIVPMVGPGQGGLVAAGRF
jgi:hypothetical protein